MQCLISLPMNLSSPERDMRERGERGAIQSWVPDSFFRLTRHWYPFLSVACFMCEHIAASVWRCPSSFGAARPLLISLSLNDWWSDRQPVFLLFFLRQQSRGEKISVRKGSRGWALSLDGHDKVGRQISSESDNLTTDSILACCKVHIGFSGTLSQGYTVWDTRSIHHVHLLYVTLITSMKLALGAPGNSVEVMQTHYFSRQRRCFAVLQFFYTQHIRQGNLSLPIIYSPLRGPDMQSANVPCSFCSV